MAMFPFDYHLPPERIAQWPREPRDHARLLVLDRGTGAIAHWHFYDLPELLRAGDLLVLNDTRVVPARLIGRRAATGGKWEGLYLRSHADGSWELLCQTRGRLRAGESIQIGTGTLELTLADKLPSGRWLARPNRSGDAAAILDDVGSVPLPPYIRKGVAAPADRERYQTVYAASAGAVAAPTAGLHFTSALFDTLKARGIPWTHVTLHVGLGTFQPMQTGDPEQHKMHAEWGRVSEEAVAAIAACRNRGGRVIAVGTTSVRALESGVRNQESGVRNQDSGVRAWEGETSLFIRPPFDFRVVDGLVTNFHLPKTTLLLLVAAFTGTDLLAKAYDAAIAADYRFYSYGDAMLVF